MYIGIKECILEWKRNKYKGQCLYTIPFFSSKDNMKSKEEMYS